MNTSIKVVLYTSKTLSNGKHPIMLRIIKDRKVKYISTGFSCTKKEWDFDSHLPKKSHPLYTDMKVAIRKKMLEADKLLLELDNEDKNLSAHEIKGKLRKKKSNNPFVYDYFDQVVKRFLESGQVKNSEIYKDCKRNLSYFTSLRQIHFSDIDAQFLNKFEEYLKANGKGSNTIYIYLRTLRALINKAIKEDVCGEKYYPFKNFSLAKYSKIKTEKRAISKHDIEKIKNVRLKKPNLLLAQHLFLYSFYCRGMNFVDMAFLKWKDIKANRMNYTRKKTKEPFNVALMKPALNILKHYKPITFTSKESYVFPIFNDNHISAQTVYNRKVKMLRQINKDLKTIAAQAKISAELTTYVARHSYATILKKSGISTSLISEALGHGSEKTTQIYLESFGNDILDEASRAVL